MISLIELLKNVFAPKNESKETLTFFTFDTYDLNDIDVINSIPIPKYKPLQGLTSPVNNIEYILQRKATEHKKNGNEELALACLRKSNEIMPYSNFSYTEKDYLRLVEFLEFYKRYDEADQEKKILEATYPHFFDPNYPNPNLSRCSEELILFMGSRTCPLCSIYNMRIFSRTGKDKRFPQFSKIPPELTKRLCPICNTYLGFSNYYVIAQDKGTLSRDIKNSNLPFIDKRTPEEKQLFENELKEKKRREAAEKEFKWIRRNLPELAPQSLAGYSKMKNSNSINFQKIREKALAKGFVIEY